MAISDFPNYVAEARTVQESYKDRIAVRVGLEADYIEGREDDLRALLVAASQPLDYVLGSVHYARGRNIFERKRWEDEDAEETYADYYRLVACAARSGLFDILSHLTAVEAFGPPISEALAARLYPPAADAVAESGCLVEINTSGYRKMGGDEPFPNRRMLRLLVDRGVPLTFGADSHTPSEVGFGRDRAASLLADLGVATKTPVRVASSRGGGSALMAFATTARL
jgi:histidinol-phosphatase (PHP family)